MARAARPAAKQPPLSPGEAALVHSVCRDSLYEFARRAWEHIEPAALIDNWHIGAVCEHLQAVSAGQIRNLLITVPPGTSKSLLASVMWPAWEWTRRPEKRWFYASYDQRLSTRDSVRCRTLIRSRWYQSLFGGVYQITDGQDMKTYYETDAGGFRLATSVGGHGTGEHPHTVCVDDPHNVKEAESDVERRSTLDWWDLTMSTRGVSLGVTRVIIMQRLHWDDLAGHVLKAGGWDHINLCMRHESAAMPRPTSLGWTDPRAEEGQLLAPRQFDEAKVAEMERALGVYGTASQLQQRPTPRKGGMFEEAFFGRRVRSAPYAAARVRYWDRASTKDGGCRTAGVLMARGADDRYYVEHVVAGQWAPRERNLKIRATAQRDRLKYGPRYEPVIWVEREGGASGRDAWEEIARQLAGFRVREHNISAMGNKLFRAEPWSDQLAAGNVYLVDGGASEGVGRADWDVQLYVDEHCGFPLGQYKDQVDGSSGAFSCLAGARMAAPLKVFHLRKPQGGGKGLRLVVCARDELEALASEERCLLVSLGDPEFPEETLPGHGLGQLADSLLLHFADIDPGEIQDRWGEPLEGGALPEEAVMTREHGKRLWSFLTRRRDPYPELIVVQDLGGGDRRARSVARAVAECLRLPKGAVQDVAGEAAAPEGDGLNAHVVATTRVGRGLVVS